MLSCPSCGKAIPAGAVTCRACQPAGAPAGNMAAGSENDRFFRCENGHYYDHVRYRFCPFCKRRGAPPWAIVAVGAALLIGAGVFFALYHARSSYAQPGLPSANTHREPAKPAGEQAPKPTVPIAPRPGSNEAGPPPPSPREKAEAVPEPNGSKPPSSAKAVARRKSNPSGPSPDNPESDPSVIEGGGKVNRQDKTGKQ